MLIKLRGRQLVKYRKSYIKFDQNHLMVFEALLDHGGRFRKYVDKQKRLRYSEHFGLIDFKRKKVDKIIVSGRTARQDKDDNEILLPIDPDETPEYEYMFHTHPPTPYEGARAKQGVLYEFPSVSDVFHFVYYYNTGNIQGSVVVAPEGIYVIRATAKKPITIHNENFTFKELTRDFARIQAGAIGVYGTEFPKDKFFKEVAQDREYIRQYNKSIGEWMPITIDYHPRRYDDTQRRWIYSKMKLPVEVIEDKNVSYSHSRHK